MALLGGVKRCYINKCVLDYITGNGILCEKIL